MSVVSTHYRVAFRSVPEGMSNRKGHRPVKATGAGTGERRDTRGQSASEQPSPSYSVEDLAARDRGMRILARMLARAHLRRHGIPVSDVTESATQVDDGAVEVVPISNEQPGMHG